MSARGGGTPVKGFGGGLGGAAAASKKEPTHIAIARIQKEREDRRRSAETHKRVREEELSKIESSGMPVGDADFQRMIMMYRDSAPRPAPLGAPGEHDITVVVRKRPINKRELAARDWDSVTCVNPRVVVHAPKLKVDGITKYLDNSEFEFDYTFDERMDTEALYRYTVKPLVAYAFERRGRGTCIAYGQTGSGKTFTITGLHKLVARDVFRAASADAFAGLGLAVHVSFLEIYGARCVDLLHGRAKVSILEDAKQRVVCAGLEEEAASSPDELLDLIARGNAERATHATEVNSQSSRSHAICEITLRGPGGRVHGSISLVDLAGSERAADSRNHNQQRRIESAEINKSLLALKECIRALVMRAGSGGDGGGHVHLPFRASKLTLVLRESFTSPHSRLVMIATVSPNASSADHTQNTLRYADRVKEKLVGGSGGGDGASGGGSGGAAGYAGAGFLDTIVGGDGDDEDDGDGELGEAGDGSDDEAEAGAASHDASRRPAAAAAGGAGRAGPTAAAAARGTRAAGLMAKPRMSPVIVVDDGDGDGSGAGAVDEVEEEDESLRGVPAPTSVPRASRAAASAATGPGGRAPPAAAAGLRAPAAAARAGPGSSRAAAAAAATAGTGAARPVAAAASSGAAAPRAAAAGARESKAADDDDIGDAGDFDGDGDDADIAPDAMPLPAALRQHRHGAADLQPPQLAPPSALAQPQAAAPGAGAGGFRKLLQRGAAAGSSSASVGGGRAAGEEPLPASSALIAAAAAAGAAGVSSSTSEFASAAVAADREREKEREKEGRLKDRLRERGKLFRASSVGAGGSSSGASAGAPAPAAASASGSSSARAALGSAPTGSAGAPAAAGRPPINSGAAAMPHHRDDDDDRDEPLEQVLSRGVVVDKGGRAVQAPRGRASLGGAAASSSSSAAGGGASSAGPRVAQSFVPLPGQGQLPGVSATTASDARRSSRDRAAVPGASTSSAASSAASAAAAASSASSAASVAAAKSGADADLALLHTLRRSELNSRGGSAGGSRPVTAAATDAAAAAGRPLQVLGTAAAPAGSGSAAARPAGAAVAGSAPGGRPRTGAGGGAAPAAATAAAAGKAGSGPSMQRMGGGGGGRGRGGESKAGDAADGDTDDGISEGEHSGPADANTDGEGDGEGDGEDALLALHATAAHILEEEEDLLTQHMHAVQENAAQLREESDLLSRLQGHAGFGGDGGDGDGDTDIDVGTYAGRLEAILRERVRTARGLLSRLQRFRQHLAREERLSMTLGADDMRLA